MDVARAYAADLAANFPFLRPAGAEFERFAERSADALFGVDDEVPARVVEEGLALLDAAERHRLVRAYASRLPEQWAALLRDVGDRAAEEALVTSAVRAAIEELREPSPLLLAMLEQPETPGLPYHALAFVLGHRDVWSLEDAIAAAEAAAPAEQARPAWEAAVAGVVRERFEAEHAERIRRLAARLETWLPFDGFPRTSDLLRRGCAQVAHDDAMVVDVAVSLLATYVVYLVGPPAARGAN